MKDPVEQLSHQSFRTGGTWKRLSATHWFRMDLTSEDELTRRHTWCTVSPLRPLTSFGRVQVVCCLPSRVFNTGVHELVAEDAIMQSYPRRRLRRRVYVNHSVESVIKAIQ